MTLVLAILVLLTCPIFVALLRRNPGRRWWAFVAIGAIPFLPNLPLEGFLYGWSGWSGTTMGIAVSPIDTLALALIVTRRRTIGKLPFWPVLGIYGAALFTSIFFAPLWIATTFAWWQFGRLLLLLAAVSGEGHKPDVRNGLLMGLAIGLSYQAGFVIFQKLTGVVQAPGTMGHQNILGLMIELTVLPLIGALLGGNRSKMVIFGISGALICVAGSGSRGTMGIAGAAILALLLISLVRRSTPFKFRIAALATAALVIATPFALATLNTRFGGASYVTEEATRATLEEAARAMAADYPLGVGANQFVLVSNRDGYAERAGVSWLSADRSKPPHNAYLLARAETGRLGELAFFLLLCVPMIIALRLAFANRKWVAGELALGSAMALAANALHNNYEFAVHTFPVQAVLFMNLGLIAGLAREYRMARVASNEMRQRQAAGPVRVSSTWRSARQSALPALPEGD